ncbi:MAG: hypothetical protein QXF04_03795 [Candidatus Aenigmatarchaeota archaeon]
MLFHRSPFYDLIPIGASWMSWYYQLEKYLRDYLSSRMPGILSFLNILCYHTSKRDCIELLFTSPSKLYHTLLYYHQGDYVLADHTFILAFLNPLALHLRRPELVHELVSMAKLGRDKDFIETIKKHILEGVSS